MTMSGTLLIQWVVMETIVNIVFYQLNTRVFSNKENEDEKGLQPRDVLKGMLERIFLIIGLVNGYPHVITAFAALKIGTRINDKEHKISNDYFLIGNLISLLAAICFVLILQS